MLYEKAVIFRVAYNIGLRESRTIFVGMKNRKAFRQSINSHGF